MSPTRSMFALVLSLFVQPVFAANMRASDATSHVGQFATIEGVVAGVETRLNRTTYVDIGGRYPNQAVSGVIFRRDASAVGDVSDLNGKRVRLVGTIYLFRGYPEIMIRSRDQIRIAR